MAATRKPLSSPDPAEHLSQALREAMRQVFSAGASPRLGLGLSAGPDSAALAMVAAAFCREQGIELHAFHVHHGLHPDADAWAAQARDLAGNLGLPFHQAEVSVAGHDPAGLEGAARRERYQALNELAGAVGTAAVLLAHHLDDQAETVLIRLLRGAGPEGMTGMALESSKNGVRYLRPWLDVPRGVILDYMRQVEARTGYRAVQDPSNLDTSHARGVLRTAVLPAIERHWPGYRGTLARHARHAAQAAAVLREVAAEDLDRVRDADALCVSRLHALPPMRRAMALRAWLAEKGLGAPTEARLQDLLRQLQAPPDRHVLWRHDGASLRRVRDRLVVES